MHDSLLPVNNGVFLVEEGECYEGVTNPCDFDIDIFHNRRIIDAKSILGVLSLDLTQVLTVRFYGKDTAFEDVLQRFCVA